MNSIIHLNTLKFGHPSFLNAHDKKLGLTGASCHTGQVVTMALKKKLFTRTQHRSHIRCVCEYRLFFCLVLCDRISCLDQRSSFTFSSTEKKFYSPNFYVMDIKHFFQCNRLLYYLKECFFT